MTFSQATHVRTKPPEWMELLELTNENIGDTLPPSDTSIRAIGRAVNQLDDETLEANRYYGIGELICQSARQLADDGLRQTVVETSGASLLYGSESTAHDKSAEQAVLHLHKDGFHLGDLHPSLLNPGLRPLNRTSAGLLDPPTRVLADTLTVTASNRKATKGGYTDRTDTRLSSSHVQQIRRGEPTADAVTRDSMAGAAYAYRAAYLAQHDLTPADNPVVTADGLRGIDATVVMGELSGLHQDKLAALVTDPFTSSVVEKTQWGKLRTRRTLLARYKGDVPDSEVEYDALHLQTLKCPARNVTGMIAIAGNLVPDILESAEDKLEALRRRKI